MQADSRAPEPGNLPRTPGWASKIMKYSQWPTVPWRVEPTRWSRRVVGSGRSLVGLCVHPFVLQSSRTHASIGFFSLELELFQPPGAHTARKQHVAQPRITRCLLMFTINLQPCGALVWWLKKSPRLFPHSFWLLVVMPGAPSSPCS